MLPIIDNPLPLPYLSIMQSLNTRHRMVARELALGRRLKEVCEEMDLKLSTWQQIASKPLFKAEVQRIAQEIEKEMIQAAGEDPVRRFAKSKALPAVNLLAEEMTNDDPSQANSNSRQNAAKALLSLGGYSASQPQTQVNLAAVNIAISPAKLEAMLSKFSLDLPGDLIVR